MDHGDVRVLRVVWQPGALHGTLGDALNLRRTNLVGGLKFRFPVPGVRVPVPGFRVQGSGFS